MVDQLHPKAFFIGKVYYWNCRLNGQTAILAGPFATAQLAEACAEVVSPIVVEKHPETRNATFGVVELNAPGTGAGYYNQYLPPNLLGELLIDTGHRSH